LYEVSAGLRSTRNEDGGILLDIDRGRILRLNVTGLMIFDQLLQGQTEAQIIAEISRQCNISPDIIEGDLIHFLRSLERLELIRHTTRETTP
jgi:Coenzyme PQQ synthesis protein D (PqqD)